MATSTQLMIWEGWCWQAAAGWCLTQHKEACGVHLDLIYGSAMYFKYEGLFVASWWARLSLQPPFMASLARSVEKGSLIFSSQVF